MSRDRLRGALSSDEAATVPAIAAMTGPTVRIMEEASPSGWFGLRQGA